MDLFNHLRTLKQTFNLHTPHHRRQVTITQRRWSNHPTTKMAASSPDGILFKASLQHCLCNTEKHNENCTLILLSGFKALKPKLGYSPPWRLPVWFSFCWQIYFSIIHIKSNIPKQIKLKYSWFSVRKKTWLWDCNGADGSWARSQHDTHSPQREDLVVYQIEIQ